MAREGYDAHVAEEIARLRALQRVNPSVRDEEIAVLEARRATGAEALRDATLNLQALRLIVTR